MAVTLDAALAAAQEYQSRHPKCRLLSCENVDSIPFNGEYLSTSAINEQYPAARIHANTGRLVMAHAIDTGYSDTIRYGYTDADRTFFTFVDFVLDSGHSLLEVSLCDTADGYIAIIWAETDGTNRYIKYRKITATGVNVVPAVTGTIHTQSGGTSFLTGPFSILLADDSYLVVYGHQDGDSHYHLYIRTSSNLTSWSAESEIALTGLTDANRKANPYIIETLAGPIWLLFDYVQSIGPSGEELTNIYYVTSTDALATVSAPAALTAYTDYTARAEHPAMAQPSANQIYFIFNKMMASLHMDQDTDGWLASYCGIGDMHIDVATQKLYVTSVYMGAGSRALQGVAQIDLATWTIDKFWDNETAPGFPDYYFIGGTMWWDVSHNEGKWVAVCSEQGLFSVLNSETDTIQNYSFYDMSAYGVAKNITWEPWHGQTYGIERTWIDQATNRIYILLLHTYFWGSHMQVGWIDLTYGGPNYTFNTILTDDSIHEFLMAGIRGGYGGWWQIVPEEDLIVVSFKGGLLNTEGMVRLYTLSTGGIWKSYTTTLNPSFPKWGLTRGIYQNGIIAGSFAYTALYAQEDFRGLCLIDIATDIVTYDRPTWATVDDYGMYNFALTDTGEYIIGCNTYGVTLYDGTTWTLYNSDTVPGLIPDGRTEQFVNALSYNPTTGMIVAGAGTYYGTNATGFIMFSRYGYLKQSNYRLGTYTTGWSWAAATPLVTGYTDYGAAPAIDPDDGGLYAFWTSMYVTELSTKWDKQQPAFDLSSYILRGTNVTRTSRIDPTSGNWDSSLDFTASHGHLFDPSNDSSLLRQYLSRGRKITVQFGEAVSGISYWEPPRHFVVTDDPVMVYKKGDYPTVHVSAETPRRRWDQIHIVSTDTFSGVLPEEIIRTLLLDHAGIPNSQVSLGTWDNTITLDYQGVDTNLGEVVDQIAFRFGYAIRDGESGIIEAIKITDSAAVSRTYTDSTKVINGTPKSTDADFVNRWTVECEERSFIEIILPEELAAELMASHRWNTGTKSYVIYYTQGSKIYRNPRLEVVQSVTSLAFQLAGNCSETLLDISRLEGTPETWDTYCVIRVSSPDLTPAFIAALAGLVAAYFYPDWAPQAPSGVLPTYRVGSYLCAFFIFMALNILGSTGNFAYRIHGQPVSKVRRTVSASADDAESQTRMGQIIADTPMNDPLCGSAPECQTVANFLKMVGMAERKRWGCEKVADLRVEEGDTISLPHPFTGNALTVYLTDMKYIYQMPKIGDENGQFTQEVEGWRL